VRKYILWLTVLVLSVATAGAATINVPGDQPTIQAGIDAAALSGDTVLVARDTYTGDGNRDIDFGGKAVVLLSQSGPDVTIIDCQGTESVPYRGFYFHTGEDSTAIIEGFTIRNGHGPLYGVFVTVSRGGAILCDSISSPRITNCVFESNAVASAGGGTGGAIYCTGGSSPIIEDCRFTGNTADGGLQGKGGGVGTEGAAAVFVNCTFSGNSACLGGGVSIQDSVAYFDNCEFTGNSALAYDAGKTGGSGAGIFLSKSASRLTNCVFSENISYHYEGTSNDAAGKGGGLTCYRSAAALVNCTFYGNVAEPPNTSTGGKGGGIYCVKASPLVERTIIAFNESDGIYCDSAVSNPMLYCCNVYGNDNGLGDWVGCILTQDNVADNFSAHPRFCSLFPPDLTLQDNSPCAPDNSPCGELVGALAVACPASAVEDQDNSGELPDMFTLKQNYPNPFNPATTIDYALPERLHVTLTVYNVLGQEIATLVDESQAAGSHRAIWHGTDKQGRPVSSGVYLYRLSTEKFMQSKKMILLK